jgi:hypothetical protein
VHLGQHRTGQACPGPADGCWLPGWLAEQQGAVATRYSVHYTVGRLGGLICREMRQVKASSSFIPIYNFKSTTGLHFCVGRIYPRQESPILMNWPNKTKCADKLRIRNGTIYDPPLFPRRRGKNVAKCDRLYQAITSNRCRSCLQRWEVDLDKGSPQSRGRPSP